MSRGTRETLEARTVTSYTTASSASSISTSAYVSFMYCPVFFPKAVILSLDFYVLNKIIY